MKTLLVVGISTLLAGARAEVRQGGYLEVPVEGKFGVEITARGIEEALKNAECLGAGDVVFAIDSAGGDQLVARDVYNVLGKYGKSFRYHAVIRQATGVSLAVVVWCENVFIRPGGKVGGVNLVIDEATYPGVEPSVVLLNLALNLGEEARRHGHPALLVRAMVDPSEDVHAWKGPEGKIGFSRYEPSVSRADLLLDHRAGKVLTLDDRQAVLLGFARPFDGKIDRLGDELCESDWVSKGDAGRTAVAEAARVEEDRRAAFRNDRQNFLVDQNRRRREAAKAAVERFLNLANEWNPKLETYSTYKDRGYLWNGFWDGWVYETGRLTPEARRKWRDRTDVTVAALSKARTGVLEMKELEKEAKSLGQPPLYAEGKLEAMRLDLELKIEMLSREREKRFKDEK